MTLLRSLTFIGCVATAAGCSNAFQPQSTVALAAPPSTFSATQSAGQNLLYVANPNVNLVNFYAYSHGVAGDLIGSIHETDPTGICSDNAGNVFVVSFEGHRIDKFAHGATVPESSITLPSGFPDSCAVDLSNGNLAVSIEPAHDKFFSEWFVRVYLAGGPKNQDFYAFPGFTDVRSVAYDGSHDLFAIGDPCSASGYCTGYSSVGPPGLYEVTPSTFTLSALTVKGVKLRNPTGLAWVNPSLLVDDSGLSQQRDGRGH